MKKDRSNIFAFVLPKPMRAKAEKKGKEEGFENLSQFLRHLLRQATK
jgi:hypothetical protein